MQPQCHLSSEREAVFPLNTQLMIARNIKESSSEQYSSLYFTSGWNILHLLSLFCTKLEPVVVVLVAMVSRPPPPPRSACWPQHKARPVLACLLTARLRLAQFCKLAKSLAKYPFCPRNSELCVLSRKYLHWLPSTSAKLSKTSVSQRSAQNIDCAENGKHI